MTSHVKASRARVKASRARVKASRARRVLIVPPPLLIGGSCAAERAPAPTDGWAPEVSQCLWCACSVADDLARRRVRVGFRSAAIDIGIPAVSPIYAR